MFENMTQGFVHSYASPVDHQITPCASSKGQSDEYDSKPYSESEHSVSSCFTSCEYCKYLMKIYKNWIKKVAQYGNYLITIIIMLYPTTILR